MMRPLANQPECSRCNPSRRLFGGLHAAVCAVASLVLFLSGCVGGASQVAEDDSGDLISESDVPADPTQPEAGRDTSVFERPVQRLVVEFKVHRFIAPQGRFSEDSELWKLVTGKLPVASEGLRLADNGFRAAIGRESDRFPLREWLDSMDDIAGASDTTVPDATKLVDVDIGACGPQVVVFHYDAAGSLSGHEFLNAKARFRISFELRPPDLQTSVLTVTPEIEEPPGPLKWVITDAGARQVPQERRYTFDDLRFRAEIPAGGFLLLGPVKTVYDQPLLGRAFFCGLTPVRAADDSESLRESIFVISPIIRAYTDAERASRQDGTGLPM